MDSALNNLTIETAETEKEVAEQLTAALEMEVEDTGEGEEGGDGTQRSMGDLDFLTQDAYLIRTTPIDACNGFNELSRLAMLWTVRHSWTTGQGSRSIAIDMGRNFYSASRGIRHLQS